MNGDVSVCPYKYVIFFIALDNIICRNYGTSGINFGNFVLNYRFQIALRNINIFVLCLSICASYVLDVLNLLHLTCLCSTKYRSGFDCNDYLLTVYLCKIGFGTNSGPSKIWINEIESVGKLLTLHVIGY